MIIENIVSPAGDARIDEVLADIEIDGDYGVLGEHESFGFFEEQAAAIEVHLVGGKLH